MEEFELKSSLEGFTKDSEEERDELKALCEDALHFLERMESTYDTSQASGKINETTEGIETFRPQLAHLRQRSEEIFTGGVITKRLEFEPVLENIYDRWYKLVKGADISSGNQDAPPLTSIIKAEPTLHLNKDTHFPAFDDTDEVIDTLPEDDSLTNSNQSSPLKRNLPVSPIATSNKSNIESNKSNTEETSIKRVCILDTNMRSPERTNIGAITYSLGDELNNRPPFPQHHYKTLLYLRCHAFVFHVVPHAVHCHAVTSELRQTLLTKVCQLRLLVTSTPYQSNLV